MSRHRRCYFFFLQILYLALLVQIEKIIESQAIVVLLRKSRKSKVYLGVGAGGQQKPVKRPKSQKKKKKKL